MTVVVFLGPTLPVPEAREVLDAIYLPPAAQGDLVTAIVEHRPEAVGLIDGVFLQSLSVWHKEILFGLDRGIAIYGASSMGALRAAETAAFGMRGVGEIYRMYAEEVLEDDDEVALAHGSPDDGYSKLSEPMVNVRATFAAAERAGVIDPALRELLTGMAKSLYFADRTLARILSKAADAGVSRQALEELGSFLETGYVDLKRRDALELLAAMRRDGEAGAWAARKDGPEFTFVRSTHFNTLYDRGRQIRRGGVGVPLEEIANYVALHDDDFDNTSFHALNRALVGVFADHLGIDVTEEEIAAETARFARCRGLEADEALNHWLEANDLQPEDLRELMGMVALCRRLHRWFIIANWMERTTRLVLDELRLDGRYVEWADRAAAQERLLQSAGGVDPRAPVSLPLDELIAEHHEWTGRTFPIEPRLWAEEAGFHTADNLRGQLKRVRAARYALLKVLAERDSHPADSRQSAADPR